MGIEADDLPQWRARYRDFMAGIINVPLELPGSPRWRSRRGRAWIDARLQRAIDRARAPVEIRGALMLTGGPAMGWGCGCL